MRVLIIDDDVDLLGALADVLTLEGVEVVKATDGEVGLATMRESGPFDLVILDWMMPRMSGADVLTELERDASIPRSRIVVLTAFNLAQQNTFGVEVAKKPIQVDALLSLVGLEAGAGP